MLATLVEELDNIRMLIREQVEQRRKYSLMELENEKARKNCSLAPLKGARRPRLPLPLLPFGPDGVGGVYADRLP